MDNLKEVELISTGVYLPNKVPFENIEETIGHLGNAPPKIKRMLPKLFSVMKKIIQPKYSYFAVDKNSRQISENNTDMTVKAIRQALKKAQIDPKEIECIILGTPVPDHLIPSTTPLVQEQLGIEECVEFEVHSNCSAITKALQIGFDSLRLGRYKNIVVAYSQNPSAYLVSEYYNQEKILPENLLLRWFLSDCAAALVLKGCKKIDSGIKIINVYNDSLGQNLKPGMWLNLGASNMNLLKCFEKGDHHFGQDYGMVNDKAPLIGVKGFAKLLKQMDIDAKMINRLIITLPSIKLEKEAKKVFKDQLGISPHIWCNNVDEKGYCGGASLISYIDELIEKKLLKKDEFIVCYAVESSKWMVGGFAFKYL